MFERYVGPTSTATKGTPPAQLPPEYLDPESRFFVPEDLQPYYTPPAYGRKFTGGDEYNVTVYLIRRHMAENPEAWEATKAARLRDNYSGTKPYGMVRDILAKGPDGYVPTQSELEVWRGRITDEDRRWWHHLTQLVQAEQDRDRHVDNAARQAEQIAAWTCKVCGEQHIKTAGYVIVDGTAVKVMQAGAREDVRLCPACANVMQAELLERQRSEALPDHGRRATRGSLVRTWLESR